MSRLRPGSRLVIESTATIIFTVILSSCGPVPRPADAYGSAPDLIADMTALREAAQSRGTWRLDDCTLVVTLEPCTMCAGALVLARVERVVIGAWDPKAGAVSSLRIVISVA